jgi:hypothetical protein
VWQPRNSNTADTYRRDVEKVFSELNEKWGPINEVETIPAIKAVIEQHRENIQAVVDDKNKTTAW